MNRLLAVFLQRCPVCLQGKVFCGFLAMNKSCPNCGILYEREHGFFLTSMFVGYTVGFLVLLPSAVWMAFSDLSIPLFSIIIILETILIWPLVFRYSRVIWMHIDQVLDPRTRDDKVAK